MDGNDSIPMCVTLFNKPIKIKIGDALRFVQYNKDDVYDELSTQYCCPYIDIDFYSKKEISDKDKEKAINLLDERLVRFFKSLYDKNDPICYFSDASGFDPIKGLYKFSLHIVIKGCGSTKNKKIIKKLITEVFITNPINYKYSITFDSSVYKKKQLFRVCGSNNSKKKGGKERKIKPIIIKDKKIHSFRDRISRSR